MEPEIQGIMWLLAIPTAIVCSFVFGTALGMYENRKMLKRVGMLNVRVQKLETDLVQADERNEQTKRLLEQTDKLRHENWEEAKKARRDYATLLKDVQSACGCTDGDDIRNQLEEYL